MIELKPSIGILDEPALKALVSTNRQRRDSIFSTLSDATARIDARRKAVVVPAIGERRKIGNVEVTVSNADDVTARRTLVAAADRQATRDILQIRQEADKVVVPVLKLMQSDADRAREMSERVYDKYSVLRRTRGPFTGTGSFQQAMEARETYRTILAGTEPIELARWAQYVIDDASPNTIIIADAILRENFARPRDKRSFNNQALLDALRLPEYDAAQAYLKNVVLLAQEAGAKYASFGGNTGNASLQRISLGLAKQGVGLPGDQNIIPPQAR